MSRHPDAINPIYLRQVAFNALEDQQKLLLSKSKASASPQPGDGVCPTSEEYYDTVAKSRRMWQTVIADSVYNKAVPNIVEQLIDLVRNVPAFPAALSQQLSLLESYSLDIECMSEWVTTKDPECDHPSKTIRHYQVLGIPKPVAYQVIDAPDIESTSQADDDKPNFLSLVSAWSYIMSSRWVEALKCTGVNAQLLQGQEINSHNFWDLVEKQQWRAILAHGNETYLAPWSLSRLGEIQSYQVALVSPMTSFALTMLANICTREEIYEQCIIALGVVMMLPARAYKETVSIPRCCPVNNTGWIHSRAGKLGFSELSLYLDNCITLSCCPEGIDSLLCSVFFDPEVSCNLVGAQMTGVMEALLPVQDDSPILLSLMTKRSPKLVPLWAAAICTRQVQQIFLKSAGGTPPLGLPVASWTGIVESFIQVQYSSDVLAGEILRAEEWRHTYFITAERLPPDAPSPPFGKTDVCNLSVDVRKHLGHDHKLLSYRMWWVLNTGQKVLAQALPINLHSIDVAFEITKPASSNDTGRYACLTDNPQKSSCNATYNIFNWFRNVEDGGLWPRSGSDSSSDVRALIRHPWITDEGEDMSEGGVSKDTDHHKSSLVNIEEWLIGLEDVGTLQMRAKSSRLLICSLGSPAAAFQYIMYSIFTPAGGIITGALIAIGVTAFLWTRGLRRQIAL